MRELTLLWLLCIQAVSYWGRHVHHLGKSFGFFCRVMSASARLRYAASNVRANGR
jgi:hypothetical protein